MRRGLRRRPPPYGRPRNYPTDERYMRIPRPISVNSPNPKGIQKHHKLLVGAQPPAQPPTPPAPPPSKPTGIQNSISTYRSPQKKSNSDNEFNPDIIRHRHTAAIQHHYTSPSDTPHPPANPMSQFAHSQTHSRNSPTRLWGIWTLPSTPPQVSLQ